MNFTSAELIAWIGAFLWPFARIGAMLMSAAVFGTRALPMRLRLMLALALTVLVAPLAGPMPAVDPLSGAGVLVTAQQILIGVAMGLTAIAIIYSPWGQQSGAHLNPAVTLTFFSLGKVAFWDAMFYVFFQFLGGLAGVLLVLAVLGDKFALPPCLLPAFCSRPWLQSGDLAWISIDTTSVLYIFCCRNKTPLEQKTAPTPLPAASPDYPA